MAKYKLNESGSRCTNCDILGENLNNYIVRFSNGQIQEVVKDKVSDLNEIDEGVLDLVKAAADKAGEFGRNVVSGVKNAVEAIKGFVLRAFKKDNRVYFEDEDGEIVPAVHPINGMLAATENGAINFFPSEDLVDAGKLGGVIPRAIVNFKLADEYDGAIFPTSFAEAVSESVETKSPYDMLSEANNSGKAWADDIKAADRIHLHSDAIEDMAQNQVYTYLKWSYEDVKAAVERKDKKIEYPPVALLFGAPGTGKTTILKELGNACGTNSIVINAAAIEPEMFTMPGIIDAVNKARETSEDDYENDKDKLKTGYTSKSIADLPKNWIPVYNTKVDDIAPEKREAELEKRRRIANGAVPDENGEYPNDGPGGIFFIDEFIRMSEAGIHSIFDFPLNRYLGATDYLKLGDKWIVVCASNRYDDLSQEALDMAVSFEGASGTRYLIVNYIPSIEKWKEFGERKVDGENLSKINKFIRNYVVENAKDYDDASGMNPGEFYNMAKQGNGKDEFSTMKPHAIPRTWEQLSSIARMFIKRLPGYASAKSVDEGDELILGLVGDDAFVKFANTIVGRGPAERFMQYLTNFGVFSTSDAESVITNDAIENMKQTLVDGVYNNRGDIQKFVAQYMKVPFASAKRNIFGDKLVPDDGVANVVEFLHAINTNNGTFDEQTFRLMLEDIMGYCGYPSFRALAQLPQTEALLKKYAPKILKG